MKFTINAGIDFVDEYGIRVTSLQFIGPNGRAYADASFEDKSMKDFRKTSWVEISEFREACEKYFIDNP